MQQRIALFVPNKNKFLKEANKKKLKTLFLKSNCSTQDIHNTLHCSASTKIK